MKKTKTLKDLNRLELTCKSLHLKDYNACLEYNKLYVVYDKIRFNKLTQLKTHISNKRKQKSLKSS